MGQAAFVHSVEEQRGDGFSAVDAGLPIAIAVYADRDDHRDTMVADVRAAGLRVASAGGLAAPGANAPLPLGEVLLVDCPVESGAALAALARLDMRAHNAGARMVVSTSMDALDAVFGCLDQSGAHVLVDPGRAERAVALGRALAQLSDLRLREMSDDDRAAIAALTDQVAQIARRLDGMVADGGAGGASAFRFESPANTYAGPPVEDGSDRLVRKARPPLPDPRLVRRIIRQRQLRGRFFDADLFADPAWDMLLDLTAARAEHERVSVTSLCIASGVPPTTALRWIGQLTDAGLVERVEDEADRRRAFIQLTDKAADAMSRFFAEMGKAATQAV